MTQFIKHVEKEVAMPLRKLVDHKKDQVVSKALVQNEHVTVTLFAFDKDQKIATHSSKGDAFVYVMDGTARITIGEEENIVTAGEVIVMPANQPHAVYAIESFKMMLVVIFG